VDLDLDELFEFRH